MHLTTCQKPATSNLKLVRGFASRPCGRFALVGGGRNLTELLCLLCEGEKAVACTGVDVAQMRV